MYKFLFTILFSVVLLSANAQKISMQTAGWDIGEQTPVFTKIEGQDAITLKRGTIWAKGVDFTDGILEADLSISPTQSPAGIRFRGDNEGNSELIYLRMSQSGREDAIQYTPNFHYEGSWQLYPEHQAKYTFPKTGWVHMKIVVKANTAQLFMDTASKPVLIIDNLHTNNHAGKIGLWCLAEESFTNLRYTPLPSSTPAPVVMRKEEGLTTEYQISQPFTIDRKAKDMVYPSDSKLNWRTVPTDEDGLLDIGRYNKKQILEPYQSKSNDMVWLKQELSADEPITRKMNLDFSNRVWIFLNGQILYHGDHSFGLKGFLYLGSIDKRLISDAVYLPLKKGKNELLIAVSAVTDGWGIISKIQ